MIPCSTTNFARSCRFYDLLFSTSFTNPQFLVPLSSSAAVTIAPRSLEVNDDSRGRARHAERHRVVNGRVKLTPTRTVLQPAQPAADDYCQWRLVCITRRLNINNEAALSALYRPIRSIPPSPPCVIHMLLCYLSLHPVSPMYASI